MDVLGLRRDVEAALVVRESVGPSRQAAPNHLRPCRVAGRDAARTALRDHTATATFAPSMVSVTPVT
ncbi:hypothetical protein MPEAHAMD_0008 [Methylobacterium frigidaeris]|uniref:Uncharacterized protein n=1 Tax=Methylobacterium frigidaeris TaxID=2038277 RepID=A0AA37H528_9HYPH|nr:hypothetical protein MPEAHAMD_0008 [Methylobacterium frigidaeris]